MGNPNDKYDPFDVNAPFRRMSPIERKAYLVKAAFDRARELDPLPATLRALAIKRRHASQSWAKRTWSTAEDLGSIAKHTSPAWWAYHLISGSDDEACDGLSRILSAVDKSYDSAFSMMIDESLDIGKNLIYGIVSMLKTLAEWAAVGTVGGGVIGAFGGDVPEGMYWGFELAMVLGGYWALKDLLLEASKHLDRFTTLIGEAAELAWFAGEDGVVSEQHDINDAAKLFAFAIVELWWVVLNALIIIVLKRAGEIAAKAVGRALGGTALERALGDIKANVASKFGTPFSEWFKEKFPEIRKAVHERENKGKSSARDSGGSAAATAARPSLLQQAAAAGAGEVIDGPLEVFLHGTTARMADEFVNQQGGNLAPSGGNFAGKFHTVPDLDVANVFAARTAGKVTGGQPAVVGVALPKAVADNLRRLQQLTREPITNPPPGVSPSATQWVFKPGALQTLRDDGFFFHVQ
ncbi:MAG TPA: hypothetical protein VHZ07_21510 [Bryobacteraceae bacterium]|jgi:hypothetical protein|nr:hypothetical protein [Bryobacteraceae bacterium]